MSAPVLNDVPVSIWRNITATTNFYSFIGENGRTLAPGADSHVWGDPWSLYSHDSLQQAAMASALVNGRVALLKTPTPVAYDFTLDEVWQINVVNGTVTAAVPEFGSYFGPTPS